MEQFVSHHLVNIYVILNFSRFLPAHQIFELDEFLQFKYDLTSFVKATLSCIGILKLKII